jgi:hypothetical protein
MTVMHHFRRMRLIEGIFIKVRIMIGVVGNHDAVHCWYLGGEVRRSLPGLLIVSSYRKWRCFKKQG